MTQQVVDQYLGEDLFLDVQWRSMHDEVAPVLLVLAAPDELRVEVTVTPFIRDTNRALCFLLHHRLIFGGGDILAPRFVVLEGDDSLGVFAVGFFGHDYFRSGRTSRTASASCFAVGSRPLNSAGSLAWSWYSATPIGLVFVFNANSTSISSFSAQRMM